MKRLLSILTLIPSMSLMAASGDLDTTFSGDGKLSSTFGVEDNGNDAFELPDGKIIVVGSSDGKVLLARYTAVGVLDTTFGTGGKVLTTIGTSAVTNGIVRQKDGKLVVCGSTDGDAFVARYSSSGVLDASFGTGGVTVTDFGGNDYAMKVALLSTGKIIAVGAKKDANRDFAIACYLSNGALDTGFDGDGKLLVDFNGFNDEGSGLVVLADDRFVVSGYSATATDADFALVRCMPDGTFDTSFDTDGKVVTDINGTNGNDYGNAVCLDTNGNIIVVGSSDAIGGTYHMALARYNVADGSLDTSFAGTGKFVASTINPAGSDSSSVTVQTDGKILVAGGTSNSSQFITLRYTTGGILDTNFSGDGQVTETFGLASMGPSKILVQGNGRILIVGTAYNPGNAYDILLLRYQGDPLPDIAVDQTTFLEDEVSTVSWGQMLPTATLTKTFTIRNAGLAPLTGFAITQDGPNAGDFILTAPATTPLAPGASRTFTVKLGPTTAGTKQAALHIASNDPTESPFDIPLTANVSYPVTLSSGGYAVTEGSALTIELKRQTAGGTVTVEIKSANGTATLANNDYTALNQMVTFADGDATKTVQLQTTDDSTSEPVETLTVSLSGGTAVKGTPSSATVRIIDDSAQVQGTGLNQDAAAPPLPGITSPALNGLRDVATGAPMTVTGTATDAKSVQKVEVSFDGTNFTQAVLDMPGATSTGYTGQITPVGDPATPYKVYVKTTDYAGRTSATLERVFRVARDLPVGVNTTAGGTVSAGFFPVSFREPGKSVTITATPKTGYVFDGWAVSGTAPVALGAQDFSQSTNWGLIGVTTGSLELPTLTFIMREGLALQAKFILNPFGQSVGVFNGLAESDDGQPGPNGTIPGNDTEGFFTATVLSTGGFSGKLTIDGMTLGVSGVFDNTGVARFGTNRATTVKVTRPNKPSVEVSLTLSGMNDAFPDNERITGTVKQYFRAATKAVSNVKAYKNFYVGTTIANSVPGAFLGLLLPSGLSSDQKYSVVFKAFDLGSQKPGVFSSESEYPKVNGYASMNLSKSGAVTLTGRLPDNTPFTHSTQVTSVEGDIVLPFYMALYGNTGCITGILELLTPTNPYDPEFINTNIVQWFKPFQDVQHYPYGWPEGLELAIAGTKYNVTPNVSVLPDAPANLNPADVMFDGGLLNTPVTQVVNVSNTDVATKVTADPAFTLNIVRATGVLSGNFKHTDGTVLPYYGIIWQKGPTPADRGGFGYFYSTTPTVKDYTGQAGNVTLQAQ